ncbi:TonB-dependent receptor [Hymenobacter sp. GOD-10R]|uniref:SusC/RagA family TonB-linked outer membrane protein n=1 Tax=Hymenobacter sp. GOD-10R TaxID=3093922 RepID=UPI002D788476|nr:TonB-dependent receptor [Hymenobacter sp. GOD-10R]WRQ30594.1 TonB-dependent receptor [Hymenobacter sp. GOD-10R]
MKKPVPRMRRFTIPVLLCCLPLQPFVAAANIPIIKDNSRMGLDFRPLADIALKGRVTDEKGQGLPGVNVVVKGTTNGAQTDADGNYTLTAPDNGTLVISYVGYVAQEVAINGRTTVAISLAPDTKALNEVVVVGYLTENRQNLSSAVSSADVAESRKTPVPTVSQAIQGRVAGVQVQGSSGPGASPVITIRGVGNLGAGSNPLYVIDGLWSDNIRDLNPNDVESLTVLKDASSTAVYGSRGANGVVIITTKKGSSGAPKISFNGYTGVESVYKRYDLTNASEWADRNAAASRAAGLDPFPGANKAAGTFNPNIDTDWQKEFFQTGKINDYNLSFSGGSSTGNNASNFLISAGYFNQQGIVEGPSFERYSLRLNSGMTKGKFKIQENAQITHINTKLLNGVPFVEVLTALPGIPVYDPATSSGYGFGTDALPNYSTNPIGLQNIINNTQYNNRLQGSLSAEYAFFDFLTYRLNLGIESHDFKDRTTQRVGALRRGDAVNPAYLTENRGDETFLLAENTLNFNKRLGEHNVNVVLGYSEQKFRATNASATNRGYSSVPQYYFVLGAGTSNPGVDGTNYQNGKRSYFIQATYDYKGRYLLSGSFRRDGSSRFSKDNQYGNFGAGSIGWRISEEDFFKEALPIINNLKLRASYGVNGNDGLPNAYLYQATINQNVNYPNAAGGIAQGSSQITLASNGIQWEERYTSDAGLDLSLLDDRVTLSADYYISNTKKALVNPPIPVYLGNFGGNPYRNFGNLRNQGFELAVGYHETKKAFTYGADFNLTTIKNEVTSIAEGGQIPDPEGITFTQVGQPVGQFYLIPFEGIFQTQEEVLNYKNAGGQVIQPYASPGDVKYRDSNGDGIINNRDRVAVGNPFPKVQMGLNLTAAYKGFDLSVFLQGVTGNNVFNEAKFWLSRYDGVSNYERDALPWTPENPSNTNPRLLAANSPNANLSQAASQNNIFASTRWLEKGDYARLRNVQVGYTFPKTLISKIQGVGNVRVYLTGRNIYTLTNYSGFDPETPGTGFFGRGVDNGSYPNVRSFTAGLQVDF